jgi:hypothetical protein
MSIHIVMGLEDFREAPAAEKEARGAGEVALPVGVVISRNCTAIGQLCN